MCVEVSEAYRRLLRQKDVQMYRASGLLCSLKTNSDIFFLEEPTIF